MGDAAVEARDRGYGILAILTKGELHRATPGGHVIRPGGALILPRLPGGPRGYVPFSGERGHPSLYPMAHPSDPGCAPFHFIFLSRPPRSIDMLQLVTRDFFF